MTDPYAALATIARPTLVGRCPVCGRFFTAERRSKVYDRAVCAVKASEARLGKRRPHPLLSTPKPCRNTLA